MKNILNIVIFTGVFLIAGIVSASAQTITGSIGNGTAPRGGSVKGRVVMSIPSDLHVNSHNPKSKYAIPTTVTVTSVEARVGSVSYPAGKNRKFSFSNDMLNVYEGRVAFTFNVAVPASFKGKTVRVRAVVKYQACNDEVCFPPKTKDIVISAIVK